MAGDWIKMRHSLLSHPKTVRMMSALKADKFRIVGGLMSVWCLFDTHSEDGQLSGYTLETLDAMTAWDGFAAAMRSVEWLGVDDDGTLVLPRFDAHNGQSSKRRAQDSDRKREVRKVSASEADKKRTREEKRREEKERACATSADVLPANPKREQSGTRLPEDWQPDPELTAWAAKERPDLNLQREIAGFRDYWHSRAGKDARKASWPLTFRNWIRNSRNGSRPQTQIGGSRAAGRNLL